MADRALSGGSGSGAKQAFQRDCRGAIAHDAAPEARRKHSFTKANRDRVTRIEHAGYTAVGEYDTSELRRQVHTR
jgi:hypothetical protein